MKKLLVTAIGAAAAFGAIADSMRFESEQDGDKTILTLPGGDSYWSEPAGSTNTYTVGAAGTVSAPLSIASESVSPQKALSVKTTFGKPLSLNAVSGGAVTNINEGLYFDSLVKFTVCEDTPNESYDGAKIIMWLQEMYDGNENVTGTNLMVRAGYLSFDGNNVTAVPTNYVCALPSGFNADAWHRVTIKAIADITNGRQVPGFAIYLDENGDTPTSDVNAPAAKWDALSFPVAELTEAAYLLNQGNALFPSLDQTTGNKLTLQSASFDGTGAITDLIFTDDGPAFAKDMASEKATIVNEMGVAIAGSPFTSLAAAVAAVNNLSSGTYTFTLSKSVVFDEPLTFTSQANVILDFAGHVLTNTLGTAAITNNCNLTITNSTVDVGGIVGVGEGSAAIYQDNGFLNIFGGIFRADIEGFATGNLELAGGSFQQPKDAFAIEVDEEIVYLIASGKTFSAQSATYDGLYDVIDYVPTYTVTFISGEGSTTNEYTEVVGEEVTVPTPAAVAGKSFSAWDPAIAGATVTVEADETYTAQYTNNIYTITFVIGENSSSVQKEYGSEITSVPEPPLRPGYTGSWDDDPAGDTVTGDKTYTYTYSAETYTITFVNEIGADPASTNYTIESGTITLPTATTENVGVQFDGWTNATITTAITEFTPAAGNLGSFTLYAAWSSTGSSGYDGGAGNTFTIDPGTVATVEAAIGGGKKITDTVAGTDMTYAQAYALGLVNESTGAVDELDATIEMKDGKVVVGLSSTPSSSYTITLKVYEKASLTAAWPSEPTQTYTLDSATATTGFTPSGSGSGFYKTEVTISNK